MFKRRRSERDFLEEIAAHLELEAEDLRGEGLDEGEARRRARVEFANAQLARERFHLRYRVEWVDGLVRDVRFALRQLWRAPGFAATAILTLAIGLGANTAIFSLVNALLLRPLNVPHAERLSVVGLDETDEDERNYNFNAPVFRALERRQNVFEQMAGVSTNVAPVRGAAGGNENLEVPVTLVSGQYFAMMETAPLMGRYLLPSDDVMHGGGSGLAAVITEGFWHAWLNGAKDVVGRKLVIANQPFTIVGVMPRGFVGSDPTRRPEIYLPLAAEPVVDAPYNMTEGGISANWINVMGRRKAGVTLEQADAVLRDATIPIAEEAVAGTDAFPQWIKDKETNQMRMHAEPGARGFSFLRSVFRKPLVAVLCLCGAVLLLACLNLTSLLMARGAARERELATRLAIGASRGRLVQQLLVEALMMTSLGTAAGLLVAPLLSRSLAALLLSKFTYTSLDTGLDARVFIFAALLAMVAGLVVGLVPALRATSRDVGEQLKVGSYARTPQDRKRLLPRVLLGAEVGLALMLVIGAGLLAASLTRLYRTGLGFDAKGLAHMQLDMDKQKLEGAALLRWYEEFADSLRHQPGVASVSYERIRPLSGSSETGTAESAYHSSEQMVYQNSVGPGYFATMRIPLLAGREFTWRDTKASGLKVILNEKAAKILFPGRSALGEQVTHLGDVPVEVVGVVGDAKYSSISKEAPAGAYLSITQTTEKISSYAVVVRMEGDAQLLADASRRLVAKMAPEIPAPILTTMTKQIDMSLATERLMALLSVFFAGCALLVTGIGLYGTLAYATARRTSEIGIRMALGAQRLQVVLMVFRENVWSTAIGGLAGLGLAIAGGRVLTSFLYGTSVRDPLVLIGAVVALGMVACCASLLPAVRAAWVDPMVALRAE